MDTGTPVCAGANRGNRQARIAGKMIFIWEDFAVEKLQWKVEKIFPLQC